ncbi:MAG: hypothetical protein ABW000_05910 [Actinoplanes sp.]
MMQPLFDEMIGTPPPSTVDVAAIVRREQRGRSARRAGYGLAAVVAVAVSAGTLTSVARPDDEPRAAPSPVIDTRFQLISTDKQTAEASARQLSKALDHAVKKAVPGVTYPSFKGITSNPTKEGRPLIVISGGRGSGKDPVDWFGGTVNVELDKRQGALNLMAISLPEPGTPDKVGPDGKPSPPMLVSCEHETGCQESTGPNGKKIVTIVTRRGNYQNREVRTEIPSHRVLSVSVANVDATNPDNAAAPPLTTAQLARIVGEVSGQIKA